MKKLVTGAMFVVVIGIAAMGHGKANAAIDPATCAYYQAAYYHATGQTITCAQLEQMWRNGTYWPR